jgi:hypothetical protein
MMLGTVYALPDVGAQDVSWPVQQVAHVDCIPTFVLLSASAVVEAISLSYGVQQTRCCSNTWACRGFNAAPAQVSYGAGAYICGEETALLESLEGKQVRSHCCQ